MRIYTKTGDRGETGLLGFARVSKTDLRIHAIGEVDELNAMLGILRSMKSAKGTAIVLQQIQNDLFLLGAELADMRKTDNKIRGIGGEDVQFLEHAIDERDARLPELKNFILPDGVPFSAHAHLARAICRRAERSAVALHKKTPLNPQLLIYLNRLSDLLFILAREEMQRKKKKETIWKGST